MSSAAFSTTPRLFVETQLAAGIVVELPQAAAHYLVQVMRRQPGEPVRLFDDCTGEWLGRMADVGRKRATVQVEERLSERAIVPDLWLCAAPINKSRVAWVAERARPEERRVGKVCVGRVNSGGGRIIKKKN